MTCYRMILVTATCALLTGCLSSDPVYRTSHTLVEPTSANARILVGQCKQMRQQCDQFAAGNRQSCLAEANEEENRCVAQCASERTRNDIARGVHGSRGINEGNCRLSPCGGFDQRCGDIGGNCAREFEACVVDAGERVDVQRYCVRNCT